MASPPDAGDKYQTAKTRRQSHVDAILASPARKKVVVAGPGTGKTHLFKEILRNKQPTLTLSFINALVDDLSLELCGLSDVRTLHGFARSELARAKRKNVPIHPLLSRVIREDAAILLDRDIDFDTIFHERDDGNPALPFYKQRKDSYGSYYGLTDIVFAIAKYYESKPESVPLYDQIVVDEFQDFNRLEVSLLDLLAERSPILLAGDDDQALYDFKKASAEHVRRRYGQPDAGYAAFSLPYCSRCTRVIVEAANDIIRAAKARGLLEGRIDKRYDYFDDVNKDKEGVRHPHIDYVQTFAKQIPWKIAKTLEDIAAVERGAFSVLIIAPTKTQIRNIVLSLRKKGLRNVAYEERRDDRTTSLMDGLKLILDDKDDALGWRICAKVLLTDDEFNGVLRAHHAQRTKPFGEFLERRHTQLIKRAVAVLRAIGNEKQPKAADIQKVLDLLQISTNDLSVDALKAEMTAEPTGSVSSAIRNLPIKATTVQSSKGLAADYVFLTHLDDKYVIGSKTKTKVSDRDVCSFLVAITRAKKKLVLVSSDTKKEPTFLGWIQADRVHHID